MDDVAIAFFFLLALFSFCSFSIAASCGPSTRGPFLLFFIPVISAWEQQSQQETNQEHDLILSPRALTRSNFVPMSQPATAESEKGDESGVGIYREECREKEMLPSGFSLLDHVDKARNSQIHLRTHTHSHRIRRELGKSWKRKSTS